MFDIVNSILMLSYIFMYVGFSNSIKRAFTAQYKRKLKSKKLESVDSINYEGNEI